MGALILEGALAGIRHGMTFLGGFLAQRELATGDETTAAGAALVTLVGFGWSLFRKWKARAQ